MKVSKILVTDMECAMCAKTIENTFSDLPGITNASVNLSEGYVRVKYDENQWDNSKIMETIRQTGYTPKLPEETSAINWFLIRIWAAIILTFPLLWTMLGHGFLPESIAQVLVPEWLMHPYTQLLLATPVQLIIGASFYKGAYYNLKNKSIGMDVLVTLATTVAYGYSIYLIIKHHEMIQMGDFHDLMLYFETSATIITVILIGHYFEHKVKLRTSEALKELMALSVKEALVIRDGEEKEVPVEMVTVGEIVRVKKGEKVPLDGEIIEGESYFDEALMTGESQPVFRRVGQPIIGSTINMAATILMKVTKTGADTLLNQIVSAVEEAQTKKPKIQKLADRISALFVPVVVVISIASFLVHFYWLNPGDVPLAFNAAIAVLVISCPCALGLATPMSIMVGTSMAAQKGILYRAGDIFEQLNQITAVAFDKTGTLTLGSPTVEAFEGQRLDLIFAMETQSSHPLAMALTKYAKEQHVTPAEGLKIDELPGKGMQATVANQIYYLGSPTWIAQVTSLVEADSNFMAHYQTLGKTVIFLATKERVMARVALGDPLKPSSLKAIQQLHQRGIATYLISGDHPQVVNPLGQQLGIPQDHIFAQVSPFDKAKIIKQIQQKGHQVAFVGDGINDAVALQQANLGMAIGTGTGIAMANSHVTLMNPDLITVAHTLTLSRAVLKNIYRSFAWAFSYNIVAIPIAFLGLLSPIISGIAMAFSDITVVLNALQLRKIKL